MAEGSRHVSLGKAGLHLMDDMHFQIQEFSVDGVLRWRVKMILQSIKLGFRNVLVEQRDSAGLQVALLLSLVRLLGVELVEESITLLVELQGLLGVNLLVVEVESDI